MKKKIAKGIALFLIILTILSLTVTAYAVETSELSSKVECNFKLVNSYEGNPPISLYYDGYKVHIKNESNRLLYMQVLCNVDRYSSEITTKYLPPFEEVSIPITDYFSEGYLVGKNATIEIKKCNLITRSTLRICIIIVMLAAIAAIPVAIVDIKKKKPYFS